jgi:predicted component of type VI protein secretion system
MKRKLTDKQLVAVLRKELKVVRAQLEAEREFQRMPIALLARDAPAGLIQLSEGFIPLCEYTAGVPRPGELGTIKGVRYVLPVWTPDGLEDA